MEWIRHRKGGQGGRTHVCFCESAMIDEGRTRRAMADEGEKKREGEKIITTTKIPVC